MKSKKDVILEATCCIDGHLSFQECRVGTEVSKKKKDESCSKETS